MEFRLKNNLIEIQFLAEKVEVFGEENRIPRKVIFHMNLVLDELLTNTISYGYPEGGEHEILVRIRMEGERDIIIEIRDDGIAFNPLEKGEPNLSGNIEERDIGGLGVHLVRKLIDEIEYCREDKQNLLVMRKHIKLL